MKDKSKEKDEREYESDVGFYEIFFPINNVNLPYLRDLVFFINK